MSGVRSKWGQFSRKGITPKKTDARSLLKGYGTDEVFGFCIKSEKTPLCCAKRRKFAQTTQIELSTLTSRRTAYRSSGCAVITKNAKGTKNE